MPRGEYNHATWQLDPKSHGQTLEALLVSAHECQHTILNQTTTYGMLLIATARLKGSGAITTDVLPMLVSQCRSAHELYATYSSLLSMPDIERAEQVLWYGYPEYASYIEQARWMLRGLVGRHLEEPVFNSLLTVCFQSPAVERALAEGRPFDVPPSDSPDSRLARLANWLRPKHIEEWLRSYIDNHPAPEAARRWVEQTARGHGDVEDEESLTKFRLALRSHVYECLRSEPALGFDILEQDSHFAYFKAWQEYLERVNPATATMLPSKAFNQRSNIQTALEIYESEIVIIREYKIPASVHLFSTLEQGRWKEVVLVTENQPYIHVQSHITEQLLLQFEFAEEDRQWLRSHRSDFVVTIGGRAITADGPHIVFWVLTSPCELQALDMARLPMLATTSTLLSSDLEWQVWNSAIVASCTQVFILDISVSSNLPTLFGNYDRVDYLHCQIHNEGVDRVFIVFIAPHSSGAMDFFVAPCGPVTAKLIETFAQELGDPFNLQDPSMVREDINWLLRTVMTHLLDYHRCDFTAERGEYAQRCVKAGRFQVQQLVQ